MTQAEYALQMAPRYSLMDAPGFRRLMSRSDVEVVFFEDESELHLPADREPFVLNPSTQKQLSAN